MPDKPNVVKEDYVALLVRVGVLAAPQNPIQYAFLEQKPSYLPNEPGFAPFSAAQRAAVERAFAVVSEVVNLTFVQVPDNQTVPSASNPRIAFYANSVDTSYSGSMWAYYDSPESPLIHGSDIRLNSTRIAQRQANEGHVDFTSFVALHEVLHGLGLSHPGNYNGEGYNYKDHAEFVEDTIQYSVMSYFGAANSGANHKIGSVQYDALTPLLYDILALQSLYAPNMTTRVGDTVYGFNSNTGASSPFNFAVTPGPVVAIWDAGGTDTIDLSGYNGASLIDLNEGGFSDAGGLTKNVAIAFGVTIENAVGGAGNDRLIGNPVANLLDGGAGADQMEGGAGDDIYLVDQLGDAIVENEGAGIDEIRTALGSYALAPNVEWLTGTSAGGQALTGNALANSLTGNSGSDMLDGGDGADVLSGGGGDDSLVGGGGGDRLIVSGAGADSAAGGEGSDTLVVDWAMIASAAHSSELAPSSGSFSGSIAAGDRSVAFSGVERFEISAGPGDDRLSTGSGDDVIASGAGDDLVDTGSGDDWADGGVGVDGVSADLSADGFQILWDLGANSYQGQIGDFAGFEYFGIVRTGGGWDRVSSGRGAQDETLILGAGNDQGTVFGGHDNVDGGSGTDTLVVDWRQLSGTIAFESLAANPAGGWDGLVRVGTEHSVGFTGIEALTLYTGAGAEQIAATTIPLTFDLGGGDDLFEGDQRSSGQGGAGIDGLVFTYTGAYELDWFLTGNNHYLESNAVGTVSIFGRFTGFEFFESLTTGGGNDHIAGSDLALADHVSLGGGHDYFVTYNGHDLADGGIGNDVLAVEWGDSTRDVVSEAVTTGAAGSAGAFSDGADRRIGFTGFEHLLIRTGSGSDSIVTGDAPSEIYSGTGHDEIRTGSADDVVRAGAGDDRVDLGTGADAADGEDGLDGLALDRSADGGDGSWSLTDTGSLEDSGPVTPGRFYDFEYYLDLRLGSGSDFVQTLALALPDNVHLGAGDDFVQLMGGHDEANGGDGSDVLAVYWQGFDDPVTVAIDPNAIGGAAGLVSGGASNSVLFSNFERLSIRSGGGADDLTGSAGADGLDSGGGNDRLDGGLGADLMKGGDGDDTYIVDNIGDLASEASAAGGDDHVLSSVSFALGANVERLTLTGSGDIGGTGNGLANILAGNSGNNRLDGGAGADSMTGGLGNDTYVVDDAGDVLVELADGGLDTVEASVSHTLAPEVDNLTLTGTAAINGTGNGGYNLIVGNSAANTLSGLAGNDTLDGGAGADTMAGGADTDIYIVDNVGDLVLEAGGTGVDTVFASVTYTIGFNVEELVLTGSANINGTGNSVHNRIVGNSGNNVLDGGGGADTMEGGDGDDTYIADASDSALETSATGGYDHVISNLTYWLDGHLERLTLTGSVNANGTGNELANRITGNSGNNRLDGRGGTDLLEGGAGDDIYIVDVSTDVLVELAGGGTDTVMAGVSWTLETEFENLLLLGNGGISGTGNGLDNAITGNGLGNMLSGLGGNDTLDGSFGADSMAGGLGNDIYIVDNSADTVTEVAGEGGDTVRASASFVLSAHVESLVLTGSGNIDGTGNDLANNLTGNGGANRLDGGLGADIMAGGLGDDIYVMDDAGDRASEGASGGDDLVLSSVSFTLGTNLERLTLTGTSGLTAVGNGLANVLTGNSGNNFLNGGAGADQMAGGLGNDVYFVDDAGDLVTELAGQGTDTVQAGFSYTLAPELENLTLTGAAAASGTGNAKDNVLIGNSAANTLTGHGGNDRLDGGAGVDNLSGGQGNDVYVVSEAGDVVSELSGQGTDTVQSFVTRTLDANVEILTLVGALAIDGTGNALANVLNGNSAANTLDGGAGGDSMFGGLGDDTYIVSEAGDRVTETSASGGNDHVLASVSFTMGANIERLTLTGAGHTTGVGNASANVILGNAGNNVLSGGAGADQMTGGLGNDIYYVDNIGDQAIEAAGEGSDTVRSTIAWTLGDHLEHLTLIGSASVNATGNALANIVTGNAGANTLSGHGGNDTLVGGLGADSLVGGAGDDVYQIDGLDTLTELANEGTDTVQTGQSYTLLANFENLTLTGSLNLAGTGNAANNVIVGNAGNNVLNGMAGADTMFGGNGDDTYVIDNVLDRATENSAAGGTDTVQSAVTFALAANVENLTLTGSAAVNGIGNALANVIAGNSGNNVIQGALGADSLSGGGGNDRYVYAATADSTAAARDTVSGFNGGDRIDLSLIDANVSTAGTNDAFAWIGAGAFSGNAGELRATQNGAQWLVEADTNGDGTADLSILVETLSGYALTGTDFIA
jgi:Ca2+-binding RTX toxin-like protein